MKKAIKSQLLRLNSKTPVILFLKEISIENMSEVISPSMGYFCAGFLAVPNVTKISLKFLEIKVTGLFLFWADTPVCPYRIPKFSRRIAIS